MPGWQGEGVAAWPWALPWHTGWWGDRPQYMGSREVKEGACVWNHGHWSGRVGRLGPGPPGDVPMAPSPGSPCT